MSHDHGLFVNDLFNGEALGHGPGHEGDRGIFRKRLFDGEPLGQTTPPTAPMPERMIRDNGLFARSIFTSGPLGQVATPAPAPDSLISQLATTGGASPSTGGKTATPVTGDKSGGAAPTAYSPYSTPAATDYSAAPADSGTPWLPIALIGGAVLLTVGFVVMSSSKKTATANGRRRARRNKRARRNRRHR